MKTFQDKSDENPFKVQLSDFEKHLSEDLEARNAETSQKWGFNFQKAKPLELPTLHKKLAWEPVEVQSAELPYRPADKPKMSINLKNKESYRVSIFGQSFGGANQSDYAQSELTEQTAADSLFSNSLMGSFGKGSIVDFNMSGCFCRTSIVQKHRRRTEVEVAKRESEGSIN